MIDFHHFKDKLKLQRMLRNLRQNCVYSIFHRKQPVKHETNIKNLSRTQKNSFLEKRETAISILMTFFGNKVSGCKHVLVAALKLF